MNNAIFNSKEPQNEPMNSYLPGSKERENDFKKIQISD